MARITVSYFRKVYNDFANDKITMSRMVELLNEKAGEEELHQPAVRSEVCDKCLGRGSHVIYDTCIECKKCNGNGTQTDL